MIAIRVCPTCKRKFEARVGEPQTYCEECLELKTMSESSVCSWFFDDNDFDDDFDISEAGKEEKAETQEGKQSRQVFDLIPPRKEKTRRMDNAFFQENVPEEVRTAMADAAAKVKAGELTVKSYYDFADEAEFNAFVEAAK